MSSSKNTTFPEEVERLMWPVTMQDAPPVENRLGYRERHWEQAVQIHAYHALKRTNGLPALARLLYLAETHRDSTGCARRGCCAINPPWEAFETRDGRTWCLGHIPLRARLRIWWQERSA